MAVSATSRVLAWRHRLAVDLWLARALFWALVLWLVVALALPLFALLRKSFEVYRFSFAEVALEVQRNGVWQPQGTLAEWVARHPLPEDGPRPTERSRQPLARLLPEDVRTGVAAIRLRDLSAGGGLLLVEGRLSAPGEIIEASPASIGRIFIRPVADFGLDNYRYYFTTPTLRRSLVNSLTVATLTTLIVVPLAFLYAYAIARSHMPGRALFKLVALAPLLVPSLVPGIGLVYLFGRQGLLTPLLFGHDIYGPIGIVLASVFFTFPHAFLILLAALSLADARLYEAAAALGASPARIFRTVTVPGARYGLISAAFVVFTLQITDFGVPKVIGKGYDVLAVDIYKQVIGQQNFQMGAVVSVLLMLPAAVAFAVDRLAARRQKALLTAQAVPWNPPPRPRLDATLFVTCSLVALFILGVLATCQAAALFRLWPYDLSPSLRHYDFDRMDGGGWRSYWNSLEMAGWTTLYGTVLVFCGAYAVEKIRQVSAPPRLFFHALAMLPMAVPGMVLGLSYIFFFNSPDNPLRFLYGTMTILVISTIVHFYTVSHLTAVTALKQLDPDFEAVSESLKQPLWRVFGAVTVPVCLPTILDLAAYLFVNAMTTVSAVVFLYSPQTTLASVAVLNMDDAGDTAPAAAMGMMIFYTCLLARLVQAGLGRRLLLRTQAWRRR
ncbi:Sulfate transport system permease protein CysW [bacterium HR40]|nr:Sulfate transport system permease protein CysW [bacterium HR40]